MALQDRAQLSTDKSSLAYVCPGCDRLHRVRVSGSVHPVWSWNGDLERPTVSPSVKLIARDDTGRDKSECHHFVRNGQIQYCADCEHSLAGKTVDLPLIETWLSEMSAKNG